MDLPQCDTFATTWGCNIYATLGYRHGGLGGILLYVHYTKTFSKDFLEHAKWSKTTPSPKKKPTKGINQWWAACNNLVGGGCLQ